MKQAEAISPTFLSAARYISRTSCIMSTNGNYINGTGESPAAATQSAKPLKITIAGAGLGGLFAAITLRHAGHHVEIYESSRFATETGAAIHLPPNVNGLLRRYCMIPEDHGANVCEWVSQGKPNGEKYFSGDMRGLKFAFAYPWQLCHRIDLHNALKEIATREKGEGKPVVIHLQSKVAAVDVEKTTITLRDGKVVESDLIIGADGVHSVVRNYVLGRETVPYPSGTSAFRFLIPTSDIRADPKTAHFVEKPGEMTMLNGDERRIVMYPCRSNTDMNFVAMHPDVESDGSSQEWNQAGSIDVLLKVFDGFSEDVKAVLRKAHPDTVKLWKLLDHEALPTWTNKHVVLLGDAAHPFLPHQGQGGAQAIEDAAALGALLPLGTPISELSNRLKLYTECRYERATKIQTYSRDSGFQVKGGTHGQKELMAPEQFAGYNFDHDAYDHAFGVLKRYQVSISPYQRTPVSFGPLPSARQGLAGVSRGLSANAMYQTAYITFKTKKSYLQTFLPNASFSIKARGGWAIATFSVTKLQNLEWLGGRGCSHLGLYIHNVAHTEPGKSEKTGDFLPVLFVNLADAVVAGREEVGSPNVFATLDDEQSGHSYALKAGWEGTSFCELELSDLVVEDDAALEEHAPVYHYRIVPSAGEKGKLTGEVATDELLKVGEGGREKKWKAGQAKISFSGLKGEELEKAFPTLANVVDGLRRIEISEVVASGIRASP